MALYVQAHASTMHLPDGLGEYVVDMSNEVSWTRRTILQHACWKRTPGKSSRV